LVPVAALSIILALIYVVGIDGDNARTLLNRSLSERGADVIHLNNRRKGLRPHDATIVDDMSHAEVPDAEGSGFNSARSIPTSAAGPHPKFQADGAAERVPLLALSGDASPNNYELQNMPRN
jgi:hypothetical protein